VLIEVPVLPLVVGIADDRQGWIEAGPTRQRKT